MSETVQEIEDRIRAARVVAVLRLRDHTRAVEVAETLAEGGVTALEFTLDDPGGIGAIERVAARIGKHVLVGAGTVTAVGQVAAAREAGARFCVSPHLDPAVIAAANGAGLAPLPGIATPTELLAARRAGARLLKLFPAGPLGGVAYLKALKGPFGDAELIPTGGVEIDDVRAWLDAGATAVGVGSSLVDRTGSLDGLLDRARRAADGART